MTTHGQQHAAQQVHESRAQIPEDQALITVITNASLNILFYNNSIVSGTLDLKQNIPVPHPLNPMVFLFESLPFELTFRILFQHGGFDSLETVLGSVLGAAQAREQQPGSCASAVRFSYSTTQRTPCFCSTTPPTPQSQRTAARGTRLSSAALVGSRTCAQWCSRCGRFFRRIPPKCSPGSTQRSSRHSGARRKSGSTLVSSRDSVTSSMSGGGTVRGRRFSWKGRGQTWER